MTTENTPAPTWKVLKGRSSETVNQSQTTEKEVEITEYPYSLLIPPDNEASNSAPYGVTIDATLAVKLIRDFHTLIGTKGRLQGGGIAPITEIEKDKLIETLTEILLRSCAITIDKNVLLKTLSQPKCEGLRFYMCKKSDETQQSFVSLVVVGVTEEGKDLLYEHNDSEAQTTFADNSLLSEYAHPPGGTMFAQKRMDTIYSKDSYPILWNAFDRL